MGISGGAEHYLLWQGSGYALATFWLRPGDGLGSPCALGDSARRVAAWAARLSTGIGTPGRRGATSGGPRLEEPRPPPPAHRRLFNPLHIPESLSGATVKRPVDWIRPVRHGLASQLIGWALDAAQSRSRGGVAYGGSTQQLYSGHVPSESRFFGENARFPNRE